MTNFLFFLLSITYALAFSPIKGMEGFELQPVYPDRTKTSAKAPTYKECYLSKTPKIPHDQQKMITELDDLITKNLGNGFWFFDQMTSSFLTDDQCKHVALVLKKYDEHNQLTDQSIEYLSKKNCFFEAMINCYTKKAMSDIEKVTPETLAYIVNPHNNQPSSELNQLTLGVKTYVMNKAAKEVSSFYTVLLCSDDVIKHVISTKTHMAAMAKRFNPAISLWDLKTLQSCEIVSQGTIIQLSFHPDGTHLLVSGINNEEECYVEEWDMSSFERTFIVAFPELKCGIDITYLDNTISRKFIASYYLQCNHYYDHHQMLWTIDANNVPAKEGRAKSKSHGIHTWDSGYKQFKTNPLYSIGMPELSGKIYLTKHHCFFFLLCKNAVKLARNNHQVTMILNSLAYQNLTPYEQVMIGKEIKERADVVNTVNRQRQALRNSSLIQ